MIFILGVMKSLPPDMKSRNNFMTGECGFHDGGKVDFPDARVRRNPSIQAYKSKCERRSSECDVIPAINIRKVDLLGVMKFALSRHEIVSGFHVGGQ